MNFVGETTEVVLNFVVQSMYSSCFSSQEALLDAALVVGEHAILLLLPSLLLVASKVS